LPFQSKDQFFYLLYNEPDVFMDWVEDYGVPKEFKVGSTEHWLRKIKQMDPKRNRKFAETFEAYNPPQAAVNNAKRGLRLREKWGRGGMSPAEARKAGIDSGVTRAKKISSGSVSKHDVRRMSAFNRHRKNYAPSKKKPDGGPTAGTIAWLLWGGTSGVDWAKKQSAALGAEDYLDYNKKGICDKVAIAETKKLLSQGIDDFFVIEGYVWTKSADANEWDYPDPHTWIKLNDGTLIDPSKRQYDEEGGIVERIDTIAYDQNNEFYKKAKWYKPNEFLEMWDNILKDAEGVEIVRGCYSCPNCGTEMHTINSKGFGTYCTCFKCGANYITKPIMNAESYEAESDAAKLKKYEKTYGKTGAKVRLKLLKSIKGKNIYGTKSGQWSARKSQHLADEYEKAMKKKGAKPYKSSKRTKAQKSLKEWGDQKWKTKSGKKSSVTGERYLPSKAIDALTKKEYAKTTAAKRKAKRAGKQFSKQPKAIAKKVAAYRAEYQKGTQGPCWDGYKYVGPKPYSSGSCVKRAENLDIQGNSIKAKVDTLRGGVEAFTYDLTQLKQGDLMRDFLKGVINAFQTSIKGVDIAGIDKTLEEITVKFLPNAEMRAELMAQEGYSENEHYYMGEVWGYDEVMNFLSLYQIDFQRQFASEIQNKLQNDTELTKKEVKTIMLYPLIIGFMGGTLATIVGNVLSALYLKRKHGLWNS